METIKTRLDPKKLDMAADMLKAIAHPTRIAIVDILKNENRLTVTEIFDNLEIEQAVASHHLRILKDRNILLSEREGKNIYYSLKYPLISKIVERIEECQML